MSFETPSSTRFELRVILSEEGEDIGRVDLFFPNIASSQVFVTRDVGVEEHQRIKKKLLGVLTSTMQRFIDMVSENAAASNDKKPVRTSMRQG